MSVRTRRTQHRYYRKKPLEIMIMDAIMWTTGAIVLSLLVSWLAINAIVGCGDFTRTIDGEIIHGKCVLVPWVSQ